MAKNKELKQRYDRYVRILNEKETALCGVKDDKEKLEKAIKSAEKIVGDFGSEKQTYDEIVIQSNEWKGATRNQSDNYRNDLDTAINNYSKKYSKCIDQMKEDLDDLNTKIDGIQVDIKELSQRIESLERQLSDG